MVRKRKGRQSHGSAWHWRQTDCWYCTLPGTSALRSSTKTGSGSWGRRRKPPTARWVDEAIGLQMARRYNGRIVARAVFRVHPVLRCGRPRAPSAGVATTPSAA